MALCLRHNPEFDMIERFFDTQPSFNLSYTEKVYSDISKNKGATSLWNFPKFRTYKIRPRNIDRITTCYRLTQLDKLDADSVINSMTVVGETSWQ